MPNEKPNRKHKIGMASKHSGVTPQTVRYYEHEDLIHSLKDDFSTTRYYSVRHFKQLSNIRRYFKYGFSEDEVRELIHCDSLDEMDQMVEQKCIQSRKELKELKLRIEALETYAYHIQMIPTLLNRVVVTENPSLCFLINRKGDVMMEEPSLEAVLARWLENIHLTNLASIIPKELFVNHPNDPYRLSGHCIPTENLPVLGCDPGDPHLRIISPGKCLHTVCVLSGDDTSPAVLMPHVYEYIKEREFHVSGDVFGRVLAVMKESDNSTLQRARAAYYEYWIPIE